MGTTMTIEDFEELKEKIEKAKQKKAKAEGQLERIKEQLKTEFGCNSIEEAEALLKETEETVTKTKKRLDLLLEELAEIVDRSDL